MDQIRLFGIILKESVYFEYPNWNNYFFVKHVWHCYRYSPLHLPKNLINNNRVLKSKNLGRKKKKRKRWVGLEDDASGILTVACRLSLVLPNAFTITIRPPLSDHMFFSFKNFYMKFIVNIKFIIFFYFINFNFKIFLTVKSNMEQSFSFIFLESQLIDDDV